MRAFVLCSGRCGSLTFARACEHITNYTSAHESRAGLVQGRLDYPEDHIEVDNRLAWFLGSLEKKYGDDPVYVHLTRDPEAVAESYSHRFYVKAGIMHGFGYGVVRPAKPPKERDRMDVARLFVRTVTDNVESFLKDKTKVVRVRLEDPHEPFDRFWDLLGAEGDREAAHDTLRTVHNARA